MTSQSPTPLPHGLDLVIDFVNTLDIEQGSDELESAAELSGWLSHHGLLDRPARPPGAGELHDAIGLREALRALMLANNGDSRAGEDAWVQLDLAARRGALTVRFRGGERATLEPGTTGAGAALGRLLVPVVDALADGSWQRAKACRAENCGWAFYDQSRNRSGVWCDMAICGNRTKVRTYRERIR